MLLKLVIKIIAIIGMVYLFQTTMFAQEKILEKRISFTFKDENISTVIKKIDEQLNGVFSL